MRSIDLAVYADALAAEGVALASRLERARSRLREAAIEREARRSLPAEAVACLESLGLLRTQGERKTRAEIAELARSLAALEQLQAWVERELAAAREEGYAMTE